MKTQTDFRQTLPADRRGSIAVLAVLAMVVAFGFAAFTVDLGFMNVTKGQIQNAADAASRAGADELIDGLGMGAVMSSDDAEQSARNTAIDLVSRHRSGNMNETQLNGGRDLRFGQRYQDIQTGAWVETWGTAPYNMLEVTVRRLREDGTELPLSFARVIGHTDAELSATSVSAVYPGTGFLSPGGGGAGPGDTVHILPFAVDLETWNALIDSYLDDYAAASPDSTNELFAAMRNAGVFAYYPPGGNGNGNGGNGNGGNGNGGNGNGNGSQELVFEDEYAYHPPHDGDEHELGDVHEHGDGIPELNIYPDLDSSLPPGNRGTVDLGSPNNSTNDLKRQILHGLNEYDFSFFPDGKISVANGPIQLNGDTGISAGIENALQSIIGRTSAIPLFIEVQGNGNNAYYTVVKFVGVRVMGCELGGGPGNRHLTVQPATFSSPYVIQGTGPVMVDSIMTTPKAVR